MNDEERFPLTHLQLAAVLNLQVSGADLQAVIQRGVTREEAAVLDEYVAAAGAAGRATDDDATKREIGR